MRMDTSNYIRNVNNILRKNRRVLEELIPPEAGTAKTTKSKMIDRGFNFHHLTSIYTTKKGTTYYYCYEYGYLPLSSDYYFIVKRKDYTE
jgi:hypothetical protein